MIRFVRTLRHRAARSDFWLAGQFTRKPDPRSDAAMATWGEILGDASAKLWLDACKSEGLCR
jgi:hypothetical protein